MDPDTQDRIRSLALAGACTAFIAVPNVGALIGEGEQTERYDTVLTPPNYAFVVWAPIFAGCALSTVGQCAPDGRRLALSRRTGWPLVGAYATNALWSLAAQSDRFTLTPLLLPTAAAFAAAAHVRLQDLPAEADHGFARVTPVSTGLLLGWTTLASAVNIAAGANLAAAQKTSPSTVRASVAGLIGVGAAVAAGVAGSRRGAAALAATAGWGLLTTALTSSRPRSVRFAAAAGVSAIAAGLVTGVISERRAAVRTCDVPPGVRKRAWGCPPAGP
ncbi:hypothetical protein [Cryptosporangium minutisporangium]|uniref:Tryptophan-rich sensory protein n=1 Tax=Cryptosporangium minutisporangium TaxID=113569 RepID=A0ABP6SY75_9ACTN